MKALIDSDMFQWELGGMTDDEYKPLSWPLTQNLVQGRIDTCVEGCVASEYQCYLTTDDRSNFRYGLATILPYKGERVDKSKPHWYRHIRNFLKDHRGATEVHGREADDEMASVQWANYNKWVQIFHNDPPQYICLEEFLQLRLETCICSRDKDLNMVPGWHYGWAAGKCKETTLWFQSELGGLRCFYSQLLTGDGVDNIPGLYGVGKSSAWVKHVNTLDNELGMYGFVLSKYVLRFGSYADQFLLENARLLHMQRFEGDMWEPPVRSIPVEGGDRVRDDSVREDEPKETKYTHKTYPLEDGFFITKEALEAEPWKTIS